MEKDMTFDSKPSWFTHFCFVGENEREVVKKWLAKKSWRKACHKDFVRIVKEAVKEINYDYWIAALEPSKDENGNICYKKAHEVYVGLEADEWSEKANMFAPEYKSGLADIRELYLWYAVRIASGCLKNTQGKSSFSTKEHSLALSGAKEVAGYCDGIGNTYRLVTDFENLFSLCTISFSDAGDYYPVRCGAYDLEKEFTTKYATGVVVLRG